MRGVGRLAPALGLLAAFSAGCASATYTSFRIDRAPELSGLGGLEPGAATLEDCLRELGAPVAVEQDQEHGAILTWSWVRTHGWGFGLALPLLRDASTSFRYARADERPDRIRIRFDPAWRVLEVSKEGTWRGSSEPQGG